MSKSKHSNGITWKVYCTSADVEWPVAALFWKILYYSFIVHLPAFTSFHHTVAIDYSRDPGDVPLVTDVV